MPKTTKTVLLILLLFSHVALMAQTQTITGKITDPKTGEPLSGVSVRIKGSRLGTTTNNEGVYRLEVKPGDVLEVSIVGYKTQTISISGGQTEINIGMQNETTELGQVVMVGTRRAGRVKTETPVPVDVVNVGQVTYPTGKMDLTAALNYATPSLNYTKQSGSDGADHVELATLRGLGPDQTLVLINGKRRHQTSFVAVFGTRGRGNSGTDLNAIPMSAIDRVEILRDGASAQYGSDAIAGVMNLVLKKSVKQFTGHAGYSVYNDNKYNTYYKQSLGQYETPGGPLDGGTFTFGANYGLPLGKKGGFINFSWDFMNAEKTFRQVLDTSDLLRNGEALPLNIYRRAHGDASVIATGAFYNMEVPTNETGNAFYSFGGYNYKFSDAFAFTRNFSARPDRFVTDFDGNIIDVPGIIKTTSDGEQYFNPHIQTMVHDYSFALGLKGRGATGWNWDLSNNLGNNRFHFFGDKTFNASTGDPTKTHFDDGGFAFLQNTTNLNFSREMPGFGSTYNLALGAEFRYEQYKIFAGEEASYRNYDPSGDKATGAQGFPGYQPADEVTAHRTNIGVYADAEMDITKQFLVGLAVRLENYSDFGFTHNYKLATRLKASDNFNIRGSVSTGFRAPSLQQINFSSTFTTVQGGTIAEVKIAPNNNAITRAAGIPELKQEKSVNASLGFTFRPSRELNITVDGYWVKVKDRVVLSGQFSVDDNTLDPALIAAMQQLQVSLAQFFANAVNTTNKGVDIVIDYNKALDKNKNFKALFAGNFQDMTIDKINVPAKLNDTKDHQATFLTEREQKFILASAPKSKFTLNLEYGMNQVALGARLTYFGKVVIYGYGDGTDTDFSPPFSRGDLYAMVPADDDARPVKDEFIYDGKLVSDIYLSYKVGKRVTLFVGVDNLFNIHPDLGVNPQAKYWAFNNETGGPWDAVQMGGNGRRMFARLAFGFGR
ncbi:MAG TPA: TonB-dependent receptor [Chitinophagaceae bacterium]|nr:TonB-dependent receptor [Chitinophagaceae bacterium]